MLATVGGTLALLLGVLAMLLPLLASELSRSRDAVWGAVVLLLGLVLVTSADRLTGAPMLAVLCGGLLIGRLGTEVVQLRWHQLTPEEQARLASSERWRTGVSELAISVGQLLSQTLQAASNLRKALTPQPTTTSKRWVRPDASAPSQRSDPGAQDSHSTVVARLSDRASSAMQATAEAQQTAEAAETASAPAPRPERKETSDTNTVQVSSFAEIEALIQEHTSLEADATAADPQQSTSAMEQV